MTEKNDQILRKVQAAQSLGSKEPERAERLLRLALREAEALGQSSPALHLQLAEVLDRLRKTRQALKEVANSLALDPFNLVALTLHRYLGTRRR